MAKLIVGLGNPGSEYSHTRHNIGWDVFEKLKFYDELIWKEKNKGIYAQYDFDGERIYFLKPQTYMNLSGECVIPFANFFKIDKSDILVIHDELDLNFGVVAFKDGGGLAGHNGLKSIAAQYGDQNFKRLRMGIGRPQHGSVSDWVLGRYHGDDAIAIDTYLEKAVRAIETYMKSGFTIALQRYNKKNLLK
ncbi:aminoacyl-tRNA hydrolase [Bacteriovorax sp. Seq25_V]|uniref:aminoacyl-tRNA hydrolase n=1 Tax=Bacteriovorax sp. Seq25_V TaxID=1201288 RepID=UPI00038A209A|nr:aminoacyl-tRNA hydrolase [Bacteriovorax sp. Seq25_V]EQC43271.1 aminoacyl-tRNA hydrolase [Bacteriovorax sp. Seq25_V]